MEITFDSYSSSFPNTGATTTTYSHTIGSGSNRVLYFFATYRIDAIPAPTVSGVTYNGVAMTFKGEGHTAVVRWECWYLAAPATGTHNVVVTCGASQIANFGYATVSYFGANQSLGIENFHIASALSPSTSTHLANPVTVKTIDSWGVGSFTMFGSSGTITSLQGTIRGQLNTSGSVAIFDTSTISSLTATCEASFGSAQEWLSIMVSLSPADSGTIQSMIL